MKGDTHVLVYNLKPKGASGTGIAVMPTDHPTQGENTMTYQLEAIRATIDERLREAREYRLVRAVQLKNRAERAAQRARQALTSLTA
ncbi:hypothetical protein P3T39_006481 [Kitasatospora sp. GP82]|nr:hypothetical protein [Kitasatospora sp. GP82]